MNKIVKVLMQRDDLSFDEAVAVLEDMRARIHDEDPEEILYDEGLEPDYVFDLLF